MGDASGMALRLAACMCKWWAAAFMRPPCNHLVGKSMRSILCVASLVVFSLAGCASTEREATPSGVPSAQALLDAYAPRTVTAFLLKVEESVLSPLGDQYVQRTINRSQGNSWDAQSRTITMAPPEALWRIQDGDTVVLGDYSFQSDLHDIRLSAYAVALPRQDARIFFGGFEFGFQPAFPGRAYSYSFSSPPGMQGDILEPGWSRLKANEGPASLPMQTHDFGTEFVEAVVQTTVTLEYLGNVQMVVKDSDSIRAEHLQERLDRFTLDFAPGHRVGQYMPTCPNYAFRTHDPCMNQHKAPLQV
jgi:hypothetical protein